MDSVLFITPVWPDADKSGREKRAHQWVNLLKKNYIVYVLVVSMGHSNSYKVIDDMSGSITLKLSKLEKIKGLLIFFFSLFNPGIVKGIANLFWVPLTKTQKKTIEKEFSGKHFTRIICFRVYLSEYAIFLKNLLNASSVEMDIDDIESVTWQNISLLLWRNKRYCKAFLYKLISLQFLINEQKLLGKFNILYVCSEHDKDMLANRTNRDKIKVFTNKIYNKPLLKANNNLKCNLLFVGTLSYYPNEEAVNWFLKNVYPDLKKEIPGIKLVIAGSNPTFKLKKVIEMFEGVTLFENPVGVNEIYKNSAIAFSPLHAGGGTKLKIMEAMYYGIPVVASAESVTGLGLQQGVHYLKAGSPIDYIKHIKNLLEDRTLYNHLVYNAGCLVSEKYSYF